MDNLVIVESPTKARTLSRFLGSGFQIEATMGHIRDLPEKKLGIEIKSNNQRLLPRRQAGKTKDNIYRFIPDYLIIPDRRKRVSELKEIAGRSTRIILATDPDREGEAIAYHVKDVLSSSSKFKVQSSKYTRIVFHEITASAINLALKNPHEIDMNLVNAQQARRILDRLVGYKLSPLLWTKLSMRWLSAGRVQSVTVRLIVEREREILAFIPEEYWVIEAELGKLKVKSEKLKVDENSSDRNFIARLIEINGKKAEIKNKVEADKVLGDLETASYQVKDVEIKEVRRYPYPPFTTSTLQQAAANKYGWSAKRTIRAAQNLYEEGLITYHRTDSFNIAAEALTMVRDYINNIYGTLFLPPSPKFYKTKSKVAQEAHEAIRPTNMRIVSGYDMKRISEEKKQENKLRTFDAQLGKDAEFLYSLIWKRFLACQMNEAIFDQTTVFICAKRYINGLAAADPLIYILRTSGQKMKFVGWLEVYDQNQNSKLKNQNLSDDDNKKEQESRELPLLSVNEKLNLIQLIPAQKFTQPPDRYTEATLIKTLEEKGIGRPSTYAPIISTIQDRKYVEKIDLPAGRQGRKFKPTDLGFVVNDFLVANFPDIFDITFTARMEDELDEIANGKLDWVGVLNDFYNPFKIKLDQVFQQAEKVKVNLGETTEKCPDCGILLVVRLSKYGKFLGCPNFPKCKYTKNLVETVGIKCPHCGAEMLIKRTKRGKRFYGCSSYPVCNFAAWKKEEIR